MKQFLKVAGSLAAIASAIAGVASLDFGTRAGGSANPIGALAIAAAAFVLLKASELWT